eukprot:403331719
MNLQKEDREKLRQQYLQCLIFVFRARETRQAQRTTGFGSLADIPTTLPYNFNSNPSGFQQNPSSQTSFSSQQAVNANMQQTQIQPQKQVQFQLGQVQSSFNKHQNAEEQKQTGFLGQPQKTRSKRKMSYFDEGENKDPNHQPFFQDYASQLPEKRFQDQNATLNNRFLKFFPQAHSQKSQSLTHKLESTNSSLINQLSQLMIGAKAKSIHPHGMDTSAQRSNNQANQFLRRDTKHPGFQTLQNPFSQQNKDLVSQSRGQRTDQSPIGVVHNGVFKARPVPKSIYETPQEFVNIQQIKNSRAQQQEQNFNSFKIKDPSIQKSRSHTDLKKTPSSSNFSVQASLNSTAERERFHQFPTETQPFINPINNSQQLNYSRTDDEPLRFTHQRKQIIEPLNIDQEEAEFLRYQPSQDFQLQDVTQQQLQPLSLSINLQHQRSRSFDLDCLKPTQNLMSRIFHGMRDTKQQQKPDPVMNPFSANQSQTQNRNLFANPLLQKDEKKDSGNNSSKIVDFRSWNQFNKK